MRFSYIKPYKQDIILDREIARIRKQIIRWKSDPSLWGPRLWYYMHKTAADNVGNSSYNQIGIIEWMRRLDEVIPCSRCKYWYVRCILGRYDLYDRCRDAHSFFDFVVEIHNLVNIKLGKNRVDVKTIYILFGLS